MVRKYFLVVGLFSMLLASCSTLQSQESANRDVKKILKSLRDTRKEVSALSPEVVAEIKKSKKDVASVNDKLSYIEKEILNLKVNQANQMRDSGGIAEVLDQISSKLDEYNHRVSTVTQRLESIDSRISQLSDVYKSVAERGDSVSSEEQVSRKIEGARWANMGDSILAIQADLAELKTFVNALKSNAGNKDKKKTLRLPPFKPSLRPSGAKGPQKIQTGKKQGRADAAAKPKAQVVSIAPDQLYNTAYKDYLKGHYGLAISEFQEYLEKFPDTEASPKAMYWMGESHFAKKSYSLAIDTFSRLLKKHPKGIKVPSAMLKTSYSYISLDKLDKAQEVLERLIADYPNSGESELAKDTLRNLRK